MDSHPNGTQCTATTKSGAPCRAFAVTTGPAAGKYCGIHAGLVHIAPTSARRCSALTTTGAQCQNFAALSAPPTPPPQPTAASPAATTPVPPFVPRSPPAGAAPPIAATGPDFL